MNGNSSSSPRKESTTGRADRDPLATQGNPAKFLTQAGTTRSATAPIAVAPDRGVEGLARGHHALVAALAVRDPQEPLQHVVAGEPDRLADSQSRVEQDLERHGQRRRSQLEHRLDLVVAEGGNDRL